MTQIIIAWEDCKRIQCRDEKELRMAIARLEEEIVHAEEILQIKAAKIKQLNRRLELVRTTLAEGDEHGDTT